MYRDGKGGTLMTFTIDTLAAEASVSQRPFRAMVRTAYSDMSPVNLSDRALVNDLVALERFRSEAFAPINGSYLTEATRRFNTLRTEALIRGLITD